MIATDQVTQLWVLAGIIVTAGGSFAAVKYSKSGKIRHSEAQQLWDENRSEKADMRQDIALLKEEIKSQAVEVAHLRDLDFACRQELATLKIRMAILEEKR